MNLFEMLTGWIRSFRPAEEVEPTKPSAETITKFLIRGKNGGSYTWQYDPLGQVVARGLFKNGTVIRLQVASTFRGRIYGGLAGAPVVLEPEQIEYLPNIRAGMLW